MFSTLTLPDPPIKINIITAEPAQSPFQPSVRYRPGCLFTAQIRKTLSRYIKYFFASKVYIFISILYHPSITLNHLTNKDRSWERSEPRSYPVVGRASRNLGGVIYMQISFFGWDSVSARIGRMLFLGRARSFSLRRSYEKGHLGHKEMSNSSCDWINDRF